VPIICLHGWLDNAASFDLLLPQIINRMRSGGSERHVVAIAIDLAGHGLSSHLTVRSEYSPAAYVRDLYSVLNHLGASWQKELILIGHSVCNINGSGFLHRADGRGRGQHILQCIP
jgi:pimeloyl-ACP methyl ester carboxylesterase